MGAIVRALAALMLARSLEQAPKRKGTRACTHTASRAGAPSAAGASSLHPPEGRMWRHGEEHRAAVPLLDRRGKHRGKCLGLNGFNPVESSAAHPLIVPDDANNLALSDVRDTPCQEAITATVNPAAVWLRRQRLFLETHLHQNFLV